MSVRIYQLARQLNLENKNLIDLLRDRGLDVKSPSSTIPNIYAEELIRDYKKDTENTATKTQTETVLAKTEENFDAESKLDAQAASDQKAEKKPMPMAAIPPGALVRTASEVEEEKRKAAEQKKAIVILPERQIPLSAQPKKGPTLPEAQPKTFFAPQPKMAMPTLPKKPMPFKNDTEALVDKQPGQTTAHPSVEKQEKAVSGTKQIVVKPPIVVRELALLLNAKPFRLISELMEVGIFASMNQSIDEEVAQKIAAKYGVELVLKHRAQPPAVKVEEVQKQKEPEDESKLLEPRPPIVCILGHVDHGKTTLLDYIRKSNVVAKEAGGITQHVGAYQIDHKGKKITFLDTPGHAAFSKIRQRGATVTDIAILVVAADDGFMPQTDEALKFAQKENVPVVVAINKIDAKGANIDRVKQQMQKRSIAPEDWGGETLCVGVSALKGSHIDELLEAVLLQAEILELKANPKCPAEGVIIESKMEVGKGATATVIINKGTLKPGDALVSGPHYCKARALLDENGTKMKEASPSTPVQVLGWSDAPEAGATFETAKNEKEAKREAETNERALRVEQQSKDSGKVKSVNELLNAIASTKKNLLKVIVRADVHGSVEALVDCLNEIQSQKVDLEIISSEVGQISQSDVQMAYAAGATIVGFNTRLETGVLSLAKHHQVRILQHNIIYEIITQVKEAMSELLEPEWVENKLGSAEIRQLFPLSKGQVAGCMVIAGRILRDASVRLIRKNEVVYEGKILMLKRFKDDATEVKSGYECGVQINGHPAYEVGDIIECFEMNAKRPAL